MSTLFVPPISASMLQTLKGWSQLTSLDKTWVFEPAHASSLSAVFTPAGRVGVLTLSGGVVTIKLAITGTAGTVSGNEMPLYLWQGIADLDVARTGMEPPPSGRMLWQNMVPAGFISGLVATGGYELQTTEFVSGTYNPNTLLTTTGTGNPNTYGQLISTDHTGMNTKWICGVCSLHSQQRWDATAVPASAVGTNANGRGVLTFWTYFLPRHTHS